MKKYKVATKTELEHIRTHKNMEGFDGAIALKGDTLMATCDDEGIRTIRSSENELEIFSYLTNDTLLEMSEYEDGWLLKSKHAMYFVEMNPEFVSIKNIQGPMPVLYICKES